MSVNVLILSQTDYKVFFAGQRYQMTTRKLVEEWGKENNADLCFNLALFDMSNGRSVNYVHTAQGDLSYGGRSDILTINGTNACRGYSNGIVNGVCKVPNPLGGATIRNGIGLTANNEVIIAQSRDRLKEITFCSQVNKAVIARGKSVKLFVLQDGGGSTSEYSSFSKINYAPLGKRRVATVTCIKRIKKPVINRVLKVGCKGEDVIALQIALGGVDCDGSYGNQTRLAVRAAQKAIGITVDGIAGPITQKALGF